MFVNKEINKTQLLELTTILVNSLVCKKESLKVALVIVGLKDKSRNRTKFSSPGT